MYGVLSMEMERGAGEIDSDLECVKGGYDASGLCDAFSIVICTLKYRIKLPRDRGFVLGEPFK